MVEGAVEELRELRKLRYERQEKRALMNYEGITPNANEFGSLLLTMIFLQ